MHTLVHLHLGRTCVLVEVKKHGNKQSKLDQKYTFVKLQKQRTVFLFYAVEFLKYEFGSPYMICEERGQSC